jgi:hypothetical protein
VLHAAAAAYSEIAATRLDPRYGCPDDPFHIRKLIARLALERNILDRLSSQCTFDENDFAVEMRDPSPFLIKRFDPHCGADGAQFHASVLFR